MLCKDIRRRSSNDRLVWASGTNITVTGVPDRGRRYLSDFYTTLIDVQWRWNLLFFVVCFVFTWLAFACFYFLLCVLHGDLDPGHVDSENWKPCVVNIRSFTSAYLFSIETMSTIGYGSRHQTEECPGVYLAVMLQSVIGAGLQFALASLVVSKTRRAKRRSQTILFSDTAVTFREDHKLKLAVRIGDMRKGDVIGAHATGMLIKKTTGKQGQKVPVRMFTVPFDAEGGREKLFLCWPSLLVHVVDEHSPLWSLSRDDLLNKMYELIVILDGIAATTSKPFQARKSYHSWEILWGHRFLPLDLAEDTAGYVVNYQTFHDTYPVPIHLCSAMEVERALFLEELSQQESLLSSEDLDTDEEVEDWKDSEEDEEAAVERAEVEEEEEEDEEGEVRKDRGDENVVAKPEEGTEVTEEMANDAEDKKTEKGCLAVDDGKTDDQESGGKPAEEEHVVSNRDCQEKGDDAEECEAQASGFSRSGQVINTTETDFQNESGEKETTKETPSVEYREICKKEEDFPKSSDITSKNIPKDKLRAKRDKKEEVGSTLKPEPSGSGESTKRRDIRRCQSEERQRQRPNEILQARRSFSNERASKTSMGQFQGGFGNPKGTSRYLSAQQYQDSRSDDKQRVRKTSKGELLDRRGSSKERLRKTSRVELQDASDDHRERVRKMSREEFRYRKNSNSRERVRKTSREELQLQDRRERVRKVSTAERPVGTVYQQRVRKTSRVEFLDSGDDNAFRMRRTSREEYQSGRGNSAERIRKISREELPDSRSGSKERTRKTSQAESQSSRSNSKERVRKLSRQDSRGNRHSSGERFRKVSRQESRGSRSNSGERVRKTSRVEFQDSVSGNAKDRVRKTSRIELQAPVSPTSSLTGQRRISLGDALNMYRHRRSVTDTYLGTEIGDDSDNSEESAAILSIVSQQSREKRPDVRDVFKLRRKSVTQELMFGPKPDADVEKESGSDTRQRKLSQTQTPQRR